jgi:bacterial leucyl aminopeptidase
MRPTLALATLIGLSNAATIDPLYKIELAPGDVRTVTEKEK